MLKPDAPMDWHPAAQRYLKRLGMAEWRAGVERHVKAGRVKRTYRHTVSEYHAELVRLLGENDEEGFKALKGEQGYASEVGC